VPFDADEVHQPGDLIIGNDNDYDPPRSSMSLSRTTTAPAAAAAQQQPAALHASSNYALVGFASNRGAAAAPPPAAPSMSALANAGRGEYSVLPAGIGSPANAAVPANGNRRAVAEYHSPPPPAHFIIDASASSTRAGVRARSPPRRAGNVLYDHVMIPPPPAQYDQPNSKLD